MKREEMLIDVIALRGIMRQSGESVKGETTVIANAGPKAQKSRHSIVDRSLENSSKVSIRELL